MSDSKKSSIDYSYLINESMYYIIKRALKEVEQNGLQGDNHFYINFITGYEGVRIPKFLQNQYLEEMTIVIQYNFKNLHVFDDYFEISLSFSGKYYDLVVPFKSISAFADPSESFELEFRQEVSDVVEDNMRNTKSDKLYSIDDKNEVVSSKQNNVISLEDFIKSKKPI
ncbi:ClpXP protease specificity-enhancing factor SspB [Candidatus Bandiella numerosa]|uniref:ClpXP protease specificity-enhancing factor SspB n=1 Tax=Candidatus Bandiella numerosa TaxID=2570586 RepID=UPI001F3FA0CF|nr:ClpXP protease specificity-enhancing factor SspB [Candidatus Bandiella numerosa]